MPTRLICPSCGRALTVSDYAPAKLTCPNCLRKLDNPNFGQVRPMPVIPVDDEVAADTRNTRIIFIALVVLLAVGAILSASTVGGSTAIFHVLILCVIFGLLMTGYFLTRRREQKPLPNPPPLPEMSYGPGGVPILPYRNYHDFANPPPPRTGAVVGGFFAALGVCALGVVVLMASLGTPTYTHGFFLIGVVTGVLLFVFTTPFIAEKPSMRGWGRGVAIGMCLGMLALGPCAFCYTLTLS